MQDRDLVRKDNEWEIEVARSQLAPKLIDELSLFALGALYIEVLGGRSRLKASTMRRFFMLDLRMILLDCRLIDDSDEDRSLYATELAPDVEDILRRLENDLRPSVNSASAIDLPTGHLHP
jgi:hypothetical protein